MIWISSTECWKLGMNCKILSFEMPCFETINLEKNNFHPCDTKIWLTSQLLWLHEGYWSLLYLLPDMFPNNELKISDRDLSQEKYEEAVSKIFSFYPKPVSTMLWSITWRVFTMLITKNMYLLPKSLF